MSSPSTPCATLTSTDDRRSIRTNAAERVCIHGKLRRGPQLSASGSAAHIGESRPSSVTEASGRRAGHDDHRDREQLPRTGSVSVIALLAGAANVTLHVGAQKFVSVGGDASG